LALTYRVLLAALLGAAAVAGLLLAGPGASLGHWSDEGGVSGSASIGVGLANVSSTKLLGCCGCCHVHGVNLSVSGDSVNLSIAGGCGCHNATRSLWLGMVVDNPGTVPVVVDGAGIHSNSTVSWEAYLYGPVHSPGNSGYWAHVSPCQLPFPGNVSSVTVYRSDKAIVWVHLEVQAPATVTVTVEHSPYRP
jgi:hypothetical protein